MDSKSDSIKIISWRFAGVVIPWITIFSIIFMWHEGYIKMDQVVNDFPKIRETVNELKNTISVFGAKMDSMDARIKDMSESINRLSSRRWRDRDND